MNGMISCSACPAQYSPDAWKLLEHIGDMDVPAGDDPATEPSYKLEMRNCPCGTTICLEVYD